MPVPQVPRPDVEGAQLGAELDRLQPFLDDVLTGDVVAAGRQVDEDVAFLADPLDALPKQLESVSGDPRLGIAHMDMDDGGACLVAVVGGVGDLRGGVGEAGCWSRVGTEPVTATVIMCLLIWVPAKPPGQRPGPQAR